MWIRLLGSAVGAAALVVAASPRGPVAAQSPPLVCDAGFPAGGRAAAASRHNCWIPESGGQSAVPWPASGSFAAGSVVTVYSLRWDAAGAPRLFESGGVLVGDDGTAACLVDRGFVRSPALPGVVPPVATRLEGGWTDYAAGTVSVRCLKEDGSTGFTSVPAGSPAPGFDAVVSVDFPPAIHEAAVAESYALARYESMRPCSDWPADADPAPVSGVDCDVELGVPAARRARLSSFERRVATSAAAGRISSLFVDDAARMMAHSWDLRRAAGLAGRLELDAPWDGGADAGAGVAAEARRFGPPVSPWADCGRRDHLMGSGADSLWGAWVARARTHVASEVAGAAGLLGLAAGFDGRTSVSCAAGGDCRPVPEAFVARHAAIEAEARRLQGDLAANPARVCGIGDRVSPPGP